MSRIQVRQSVVPAERFETGLLRPHQAEVRGRPQGAVASLPQAADITLLRGDLRGVGRAIRLARRTLRTIRWNLFWAFGYNTLAIPVAAASISSPSRLLRA